MKRVLLTTTLLLATTGAMALSTEETAKLHADLWAEMNDPNNFELRADDEGDFFKNRNEQEWAFTEHNNYMNATTITSRSSSDDTPVTAGLSCWLKGEDDLGARLEFRVENLIQARNEHGRDSVQMTGPKDGYWTKGDGTLFSEKWVDYNNPPTRTGVLHINDGPKWDVNTSLRHYTISLNQDDAEYKLPVTHRGNRATISERNKGLIDKLASGDHWWGMKVVAHYTGNRTITVDFDSRSFSQMFGLVFTKDCDAAKRLVSTDTYNKAKEFRKFIESLDGTQNTRQNILTRVNRDIQSYADKPNTTTIRFKEWHGRPNNKSIYSRTRDDGRRMAIRCVRGDELEVVFEVSDGKILNDTFTLNVGGRDYDMPPPGLVFSIRDSQIHRDLLNSDSVTLRINGTRTTFSTDGIRSAINYGLRDCGR